MARPRMISAHRLWECGAQSADTCRELYLGGRALNVEGDLYCLNCIQQFFEQTVDNPLTGYPTKIGHIRLHIEHYLDVFPADLVEDWRAVDTHFRSMPTYERVSCRRPPPDNNDASDRFCDGLLGKRLDKDAENTRVRCPKCDGMDCGICGEGLDGESDTHECTNKYITFEDYMQSDDRGQGFQLCPSCREVMNLKDGCNHMTCLTCDCSFCYLCGEEAGAYSSHWNEGNPCPRYGRPNDAQILLFRELSRRIYLFFDPEDEYEDHDTNAASSRWSRQRRLFSRIHRRLLRSHRRVGMDNLFHKELSEQTTYSASQLVLTLHNGSTSLSGDGMLLFSRHLYITHHAVKFRQAWNLLQYQCGEQYNHDWPHFDTLEHLRKLTLWLSIDWDKGKRRDYTVNFDLQTIEKCLMHVERSLNLTPADVGDESVYPDDEAIDSVIRRATSKLARCLRTIVTHMQVDVRHRQMEILVWPRMVVKLILEELLDIYIDVICGKIGLEMFCGAGKDQQLLCMVAQVLIENILLPGEDSISSTYSESQALTVAGRVYFIEIKQVIERFFVNLRKDKGFRERAIALLRDIVSILLIHANGDLDPARGGDEFPWVPGNIQRLVVHNQQLEEVIHRHDARDKAAEVDTLLFPVLKHVHEVGRKVLRELGR